MQSEVRSIPIIGLPINSYFTGKEKLLKLKTYEIDDITPPISENDSVFILVTSGVGFITINGINMPFSAGTFAWLQSYHTYSIHADNDYPLKLKVLVFDYNLSSFLTIESQSLDSIQNIVDATPILYLSKELYDNVFELFDEFEGFNTNFLPGSSLIKVAILGQLSQVLLSESLRTTDKDESLNRPLGWRVMLYMSTNFSRPLTIENVAKHFKTTPTFLNHELRNITGYNYLQNLNRIRVNIACMALLYEDMPLTSIAEHSGFCSEVNFYRTFKKQTGKTPIEYQKGLLQSNDNDIYRGFIMSKPLMQLMNYSYNNFYKTTDIKSVSKDLYLSEKTIRDIISREFGDSYKKLTELTKLRHAEALLLTSDLPIIDIALNVGFGGSRSFSRSFQREYKMLPGEFRQRAREGKHND